MNNRSLESLTCEVGAMRPVRPVGRVVAAGHGIVTVGGLESEAALGDHIRLETRVGPIRGEVVNIAERNVLVLPDGHGEGIRIGDPAILKGAPVVAPSDHWIGRIVDPYGQSLDGRSLGRGLAERPLRAAAPVATSRRRLGERLSTGLAVFDTMLPIVRGQRIGIFSGSGVGKSTLLGQLTREVDCDLAVVALVGERGREVREFVEENLGEDGMRKSILVAATSDKPPLSRRRAMWTAMSIAEHFRDQGKHVLFLADSVTRFAEAHREVALSAGESSSLRGFPPSTAHQIMALTERAGPGDVDCGGDITAVFTVLVAGSDMDEPVADILRGVLDGHVVLDRQIAERGRFPAIDLLRSVSRSLPAAASEKENSLIHLARRRLGAYDRAEVMIQAGLYASGSDPEIDAAIQVHAQLDAFLAERSPAGPETAFARLADVLAHRWTAG